MLAISRQWPGATLMSNGLLILDPVLFLEGRGFDPATLTPEACESTVTTELEKVGAMPCARLLLTDATWN